MLYSDQPQTKIIRITVNGRQYHRKVFTHQRLLDFLREDLHLTGTKEVCGEGECGACGVIMDGRLVNACLVLAVEGDGAQVTTIEGLSRHATLTPLQQAFIDRHAVQCGYCIPGMILAGETLLQKQPQADPVQVRKALAGNICRCTGYHKILAAIQERLDR